MTLKVFVRDYPQGTTYTLNVDPDKFTVSETKVMMEKLSYIKLKKIILTCRGKVLDDDGATLSSIGIEKDYTLRKQSLTLKRAK